MELSELLEKDVYVSLKVPKDDEKAIKNNELWNQAGFQINVISEEGEELTENVENCWNDFFECRLGCDICGNGIAYTFNTNLSELDDTFNLRDLKLKDFGFDFETTYYHVTRNKEDIEKLQAFYVKIKDLGFNFNTRFKVEYSKYDKKLRDTNCGITSVFDKYGSFDELEDLEEIIEVGICPICFHWYGFMMDGNDTSHFRMINPFYILWYQYFEDDACHFLNFTDQNVKDIEEFLNLIDYYNFPRLE